jgi:D-3-phosphoglycerate dehydrogenase
MMNTCLVVDEMHPSLLPLLAAIGVAADYQPNLTAVEIPAALAAQPYEGLVVRSKLRVTPAAAMAGSSMLSVPAPARAT